MKLYLVRHGQTDWNIEGRKQGQVDIPLNATGVHQAELLRDQIKNQTFDLCFSSPLTRAYETAKIITAGKNLEIRLDDRLKERSFGEFEGKIGLLKDLLGGTDDFDRELNISTGGLEPINNLIARAESFLADLKQNYPKDAKVLIVSHGGFLRVFYFCILGLFGSDASDLQTVSQASSQIATSAPQTASSLSQPSTTLSSSDLLNFHLGNAEIKEVDFNE